MSADITELYHRVNMVIGGVYSESNEGKHMLGKRSSTGMAKK